MSKFLKWDIHVPLALKKRNTKRDIREAQAEIALLPPGIYVSALGDLGEALRELLDQLRD